MQTFLWESLKRHIFIRFVRDKTIAYLRYSLFFIWKGTEEELLWFIEDLNKKHSSIKLNFNYSKTVFRHSHRQGTKGKLCLTIYRKPANRQNSLHFKSAHPPSLKKSIPYSEALRISNIRTETNEVTKHFAEL